MAIASTTALLALTAASVVGQVASTVAQGRAAAGQARTNAELARMQAADAIARGEEAVGDVQLETDQILGAQSVGYAGQGVDITTGSPQEVASETSMLGALDQQRIRRNAMREAMGLRIEQDSYARQARQIGRATRFGVANTLLEGAATLGTIYGNRPRRPPTRVPTGRPSDPYRNV